MKVKTTIGQVHPEQNIRTGATLFTCVVLLLVSLFACFLVAALFELTLDFALGRPRFNQQADHKAEIVMVVQDAPTFAGPNLGFAQDEFLPAGTILQVEYCVRNLAQASTFAKIGEMEYVLVRDWSNQIIYISGACNGNNPVQLR